MIHTTSHLSHDCHAHEELPVISRGEAVRRLSSWAAADIPFFFLVDYSGERWSVERLEDLRPETLLYAFPNAGNAAGMAPADRSPLRWQPHPPSREDYARRFAVVQSAMRAGNSYLANLTCRIPVDCNLSLRDIFLRSHARYRLLLPHRFVCFSPETFVRIESGRIFSYPMKGTIDASIPGAESLLRNDPKESAEHATITDLIRNDLSRFATNVRVLRYRYMERIATRGGALLESSTEICGDLPADWPALLGSCLASMLPAGSVTGAPKQRTVDMLRRAEGYDRGYYTGVAGIFQRGSLDSCVLIRFLEQDGGQLFYKAGGGITAQSDCDREYQEIIDKTYVPLD